MRSDPPDARSRPRRLATSMPSTPSQQTPDDRRRSAGPRRERRDRLIGYGLAATAAVLWATGAVTAKWMFVRLSVRRGARWRSPARAPSSRSRRPCVYLLRVRPAGAEDARPGPAVPRGVRRLRPGHGPLHVLQDDLAHRRRDRDPARVPCADPRPARVGRVPRRALHVGAARPGVALSVAGTALMVGRDRRQGLVRQPAGHRLGARLGFLLRAVHASWASTRAGRFSPWTLLAYGLGARLALLARRPRARRRSGRSCRSPTGLAAVLVRRGLQHGAAVRGVPDGAALHRRDQGERHGDARAGGRRRPRLRRSWARRSRRSSCSEELLVLAAIMTVQAPVARAREPRLHALPEPVDLPPKERPRRSCHPSAWSDSRPASADALHAADGEYRYCRWYATCCSAPSCGRAEQPAGGMRGSRPETRD